MSLSRRNPRRDANEGAVVAACRALGWKVKAISAKGFADLVVQDATGRTLLIEVKTADGKPTPAQLQARGEGWQIVTVRTVDQAVAMLRQCGAAPRCGNIAP